MTDDFVRDLGVELDRAAHRLVTAPRKHRYTGVRLRPRRRRLRGAATVATAMVIGMTVAVALPGRHAERSAGPAGTTLGHRTTPPPGTVAARLLAGERVRVPRTPLPNLEGTAPVALADFRGLAVVVTFWASWCPPCLDQIAVVERATHERSGVAVVAVDTADSARDARRALGGPNPFVRVLWDADGSYARAVWGVTGYPTTAVIDREGRVIALHQGRVGPDWLDRHLP